MLTIKCAKCHQKILKYRKIRNGNVLKCYKSRISKMYVSTSDSFLLCKCGTPIGKDYTTYFKMIQSNFIYSGTKE